MRFEPHAYQLRALDWVKDHPRCALFLDMGLGKTVATLTALRDLLDEADISKVLVVAPKKVAESTWSTEAAKWDHLRGLRVSVVMGDARHRLAALSADADIYVTGRDTVAWLVETVKRPPFDCIVIDELTSFKNHQAKRFKALRRWTAAATRVVGLTGTPVPNGLLDLWAEIYCLDGGYRLGKYIGKYREAYFRSIPIGTFATKYVPAPGAEGQILERLSDICLTMQAKDYLTLPPLLEITDRVELPAPVMRKYKLFERDSVAMFRTDAGNGVITAGSAAGLMTKLGQFANGAIYNDDRGVAEVHDEKLERLAEIVEQAQSPVLVFYQYLHDVARITARLKGCRVRAYGGEEDLRDWNSGSIDVLLAHPSSTAYGLNMQQGGHYVVWFGTGWNLEHYQQANARLHRQGQTHPVTCYRLVCTGTVDELALAAIDRKSGTQQGVLDALKQLMGEK